MDYEREQYDDYHRHETLKSKIAFATAQIESGDYIALNSVEELREFFEQIKLEGRRRLITQSRS